MAKPTRYARIRCGVTQANRLGLAIALKKKREEILTWPTPRSFWVFTSTIFTSELGSTNPTEEWFVSVLLPTDIAPLVSVRP